MSYPDQWHQIYGDKTGASARAILPPLLRLFGARSLLEVGCGNGHWTQSARDAGIEDYNVADGPWNNREHLLVEKDRFIEANLSSPLRLERRYDMAICLEVAEHVAREHAQGLVGSLCDASDVLLFGAAIPLQGGYGHINEQWPSWWRDLFATRGYRAFDLVRPRHWNDTTIHYWYRQNCFVYVREGAEEALATAAREEATIGGAQALFDAVHPEKYLEMASYESIAMKKLLARLPAWALRRIGIGARG